MVWWRCVVDPGHTWRASVSNRTGGHARPRRHCPYCRLSRTSSQELQLKAELAAVLPVDVNRTAVPNVAGGIERVNIVIDGSGLNQRVIVEFDGSWWHKGQAARAKDAAKSMRLQEAGWTVVRVREHPLTLINPDFDVTVGFQAGADDMAVTVLDRLTALGAVPGEAAPRYRELAADGAVNLEWASKLAHRRLNGESSAREHPSQSEAWDQMYSALGAFATRHGHCCIPAGVEVRGVDLGRWVHKQRTRYRRGGMPTDRTERLQAIPGWSFESSHVAEFWAKYAKYLAATGSGEGPLARSATVWASNLRTRRARLQALGQDLPPYQLEAMATVPGWKWDPSEEAFQAKIIVVRDYLHRSGRSVADIKQRDQWHGNKIGMWINSWRNRRDELLQNHRQALAELPGWAWSDRRDQWEKKFSALAAFGQVNGHIKPPLTAGEGEHALAVWKRNNKNRLKGHNNDRARRLRDLLVSYGEHMLPVA